MQQQKLDDQVEEIELDDLTETQILRVVNGLSSEAMTIRKRRKKIRYQLYRLRTEANGGTAAGVEDGFKKQFEAEPNFGGWRFFGVNWDVSMEDPYRCVHRVKSESEEWDELVMAKYPQIEPGGKVKYPDINVREKVEANASAQKKKGR